MTDILENNTNLWVHLFAEFETFIYVTIFDPRDDELLRKVFLESKRIHIRMLYDFFSNNRTKKDDLICSDLLFRPIDLKANISENLRQLINKNTAHLTSKMGTIDVADSDYIDAIKSIIISIDRFIKELDHSNINEEYKNDLNDEDAVDLKKIVVMMIRRFADLNQMSEELKNL